MSSDLQSVLELIVLNNYVSLVIVVPAIYDYILTFSREIDYVWCKHWTWVSTMFIVVRYIGFCWIIVVALGGSTFLPGPLEVSSATFEIGTWAFAAVLSATDLVMILRVYAMWGRSRTILCILLSIFVPQVIITLVFDGIYGTYFSVTVVRVGDFSFCNASLPNPETIGCFVQGDEAVATQPVYAKTSERRNHLFCGQCGLPNKRCAHHSGDSNKHRYTPPGRICLYNLLHPHPTVYHRHKRAI
ncbi:hypothetical protein L210DRAFT_3136595 [Boletus edulis BED1]|uniref:DUF6533 domain-containing protein n=1 Tax=Boletus edulis BED1 TaxID=1328754 RepID=A0AAD4BG44_BOLED|nr:hypothetical protein L210DRAFT_3136595 [Boletus edulis BED1]